LDVEYARYNSAKTISDSKPSRFETENVGPLVVISDPARGDAYYNRIVGLCESALPWLDEALGVMSGATAIRTDVEAPVGGDMKAALESRGFAPRERIAWLITATEAGAGYEKAARVTNRECDRLLPLLELDGPVDPDTWALRRHLYCTETFRVFAVEEAGRLVAMASTFVGESGALLGNAVTHPDHRHRGYHSGLLQSRLADARALGLEWVLTDVEPGGASIRNCERLGFRRLLDQTVWQRCAEGAG